MSVLQKQFAASCGIRHDVGGVCSALPSRLGPDGRLDLTFDNTLVADISNVAPGVPGSSAPGGIG